MTSGAAVAIAPPAAGDARPQPVAHEQRWSQKDTTPAAIERALRELLVRYHAKVPGRAPARTLSLVVVVDDAEHRALREQLTWAARRYASRTVICLLEPGRRSIDASAHLIAGEPMPPAVWSISHEQVTVTIGDEHLARLHGIVKPLLLRDLPALLWIPRITDDRVHAIVPLAQALLLDSITEPATERAFARVTELADRTEEVVDLAWLRTEPWRQRLAGIFDAPARRAQLDAINAVHIRHEPRSRAVALLLVGWLASRLGWATSRLIPVSRYGHLSGHATTPRLELALRLAPAPQQRVPGLAGVTITTATGMTLALDRGPGGLHARCTEPRQAPPRWTLLGASRGETGILGEGIRQALLRDHTYPPALDSAAGLTGAG